MPLFTGFHRFEPEYFSVIHSGDGDGWNINNPCMSSIITYQGNIYLIDTGPYIAKILAGLGIGIDQVNGIFHTHAHDDYFAGLTALMRTSRRIRYFATPLVRALVEKKLSALLGIEDKHFTDFFDVKDLFFDQWNDVDGMEIMPIYSPHPVETNIFVFRVLWSEGYRSYAHFADIASLNILEGMVSDQQEMPGLSQQTFEPVRAAYLTPYDLKKIDIGGGMVHGNAKDFQEYTSIVWALRLPIGLYNEIIRRTGLSDYIRSVADLRTYLNTISLFNEGLSATVLGRIMSVRRREISK